MPALSAALLALLPLPATAVQEPAEAALPETIVPRDWLVLEPVDARGRRPFARDAVFARYLLDPSAPPPEAGQTVSGEQGEERAWTALEAQENGVLEGARVGWAYARLELDQGGVWMADLQRAHTLFVNGAGFAGDYYGYGERGVPVELRAGANDIYLTGARGAPRLRFWRPPAELFVADWDLTKPDLVGEGEGRALLGPLLVNASAGTIAAGDWTVWTQRTDGERVLSDGTTYLRPLAPLAVAQPPITALVPGGAEPAELRLWAASGEGRWSAEEPGWAVGIQLARVGPRDLRTETFRSRIDGSVQKYSLRPALEDGDERGLVLSLHGAGVDCRGQAASYGSYPDLAIVAPTNRRPFGFDWQDWGRADAYEVLELALALTGASRERIYLSGHSMGGHGVWHLAANDPDTWAAIAPSAGWESFDSYGGRPADELAGVWQQADGASRTLSLVENLVPLSTFVLHGEADDNVPADEARAMLAALEAAGASPASHFQPGAGHWWDGDAAPGADCLTWPAIFELFAASRRASAPLELDFTTVDPAVDAKHHWLRVEQALVQGSPVHVAASFEPERALARLATRNARRLVVSAPAGHALARVELDGYVFEPVEDERAAGALALRFDDGAWERAPAASPDEKRPERGGPFKRAFDREFVLVYGTHGGAEETAELLARARFDAGTWRYRANGHTWVLSDVEFLRLADSELRRGNVILYGNMDTNAAWSRVLPDSCPVFVRPGLVAIGTRAELAAGGPKAWSGDDLACLFVYPRRDSREDLVGVFASTGVRGARLGYRTQTFVSGAGFPDLALVSSQVLTAGDAGVLCAGWFDATWAWRRGRVERGHVHAQQAVESE